MKFSIDSFKANFNNEADATVSFILKPVFVSANEKAAYAGNKEGEPVKFAIPSDELFTARNFFTNILPVNGDPKKTTLIHLFAEHNFPSLAAIFLKSSIFSNLPYLLAPNSENRTALEVAIQRGNTEVANLLRNQLKKSLTLTNQCHLAVQKFCFFKLQEPPTAIVDKESEETEVTMRYGS